MDKAVKKWASQLSIDETLTASLCKQLGKRYTVFGCMLLLSSGAVDNLDDIDELQRDMLFAYVSRELKITHIAVTKPIPLLQTDSQDENILRAPTNFMPLYGDFGPETAQSPPTEEDFDAAFWVTAKQNGIYQTWAPRWTMFSRGNISEKARLLDLPSVAQAVEEGEREACGSAAVDLYAGIGYFAFSYAKAGTSKVLCWDLNPWSIRGLRRGAKANKWTTTLNEVLQSEAKFFVFNESNDLAPRRIREMRDQLPPIRHVNCGMLPSSRDSLVLVAQILDPSFDGWVHIHENFAVAEIDEKAEVTRQELHAVLTVERNGLVHTQIENVYRLKSYAPGVMHCVIDICVQPTKPR